MKPKIIAEIANAHQGDVNNLKSLVIASAESGADAVKFQWFKYDHIATPDYEWFPVYQKLFISSEVWLETIKLAKELGLEVWIDVFDDWGLDLAKKYLNFIDGFKLPPTVLQHQKLTENLFELEKPVLIGVGGWYDSEIDFILAKLGKSMGNKITLMHGFQGYPTKTEDANLARISYLKQRYGFEVGFADHEDASKELAVNLPIYAFFAGAQVLEKHIILDRSSQGYDYYSSLEPKEFSLMVSKVEEAMIAKGNIEVNESQRSYLKAAGRVVAAEKITTGQIITEAKTWFKRCPGEDALMPLDAEKLLPAIAQEDLSQNQPVYNNSIRKPIIAIAVICRLKSTRLAKKALLPINGVTSIERCLLNCLAVKGVDQVILATSDLPEDEPLEDITLEGKVKVIRGDAENVAVRMLQAGEAANADIILRITGDCPAVSPEIVEFLIDKHLKTGADFTAQSGIHAIGTGADVYTVEALKRLLQYPDLTHTEYLSFYFRNNTEHFKVNMVELPVEWQHDWRLTLDEPKDLEMFEALYKNLNVGFQPLYFDRLSRFLLEHPEIVKLNSDVALKWRDNKAVVEEIYHATKLIPAR